MLRPPNRGGVYGNPGMIYLGRMTGNRRGQMPMNVFLPGRGGFVYQDIHGGRYGGLPMTQMHSNTDHVVDMDDPKEFEHACGGDCNTNEYLCVRSCTCIDIAHR